MTDQQDFYIYIHSSRVGLCCQGFSHSQTQFGNKRDDWTPLLFIKKGLLGDPGGPSQFYDQPLLLQKHHLDGPTAPCFFPMSV